MIWEVDDDLDKHVSWHEFEKMYKRCISDENGLEPRKLYNLVVFMMYNIVEVKQESEPTYFSTSGYITVEDTLEILFVRHGREQLDNEIDEIFG